MRSALYSICFTSSERAHSIHSRGNWVGPSLSRQRKCHKKHIRISQQLGHDSSHIQLFLQNEPACYQNSSGTSSYLMLSNSVVFFFFFSSGPRAYAPDGPQLVGLLCYPSVLDVPTFAASPSPRPLPERPLAAKGGTAWARIMADNFA
jgi:hypothetical protein